MDDEDDVPIGAANPRVYLPRSTANGPKHSNLDPSIRLQFGVGFPDRNHENQFLRRTPLANLLDQGSPQPLTRTEGDDN